MTSARSGTREVRFLRIALADLAEISAYLAIEAPDGERRIVERLVATAESLATLAEQAPVARDAGLRARGFRAIRCERYLVFYELAPRVVWIHRVLHARRAWARLV